VLAAEVSVAAELDREQLRARVEPDDELASLPLDRLGEPVAEAPGGDRRVGLQILRHRRRTLAPKPDTPRAARWRPSSETWRRGLA
jgi:hypothetical protein